MLWLCGLAACASGSFAIETMNELVVMHLLGFFGVLLAFLFVYPTIGSVREARRAGSLGGLATRNETIYYFKELLWVL